MKKMSALSVRQPYAELILQGKKTIEYRSIPTKKRGETVYIYASKTPGYPDHFEEANLKQEELPAGVIVGTVEIVSCEGVSGDYEWSLSNPIRFKKTMKPKNQPQVVWFFPF
jgi:hypothetical protein